MTIKVPSSQAQQNFGRIMDQAVDDGEVVVERYGQPRVVILGYRRYEELVLAERAYLRQRLQEAAVAVAARAAHLSGEEVDQLIEQARSDVERQER